MSRAAKRPRAELPSLRELALRALASRPRLLVDQPLPASIFTEVCQRAGSRASPAVVAQILRAQPALVGAEPAEVWARGFADLEGRPAVLREPVFADEAARKVENALGLLEAGACDGEEDAARALVAGLRAQRVSTAVLQRTRAPKRLRKVGRRWPALQEAAAAVVAAWRERVEGESDLCLMLEVPELRIGSWLELYDTARAWHAAKLRATSRRLKRQTSKEARARGAVREVRLVSYPPARPGR